MSEDRERRLVAQAIERGLVTTEQIEACRKLQEQAGTQPPPALLQLLLQQGYLTREQVVQIVTGGPKLPDLDRCDLVRELGVSSLAATCVLRDPANARLYVLKVIHPSLSRRKEFIDRLRHDVGVASQIADPHVVRLLGVGEKLADTFIVGEYVEGASLADLLKAKGKLEPHEALSVGLACAKALTLAHERGLTHGAVAPTNVLVAQDGTVKVADLGLPRPPAEEISVTRTGEGVRSPHYLSPEHLHHEAKPDIRSDLFCLGSVLYHSLTGQRPFRGDTTAEVMVAIQGGAFQPFAEAAPAVPRAFAVVVEKLLQGEPLRRYQTPGELLHDLEALQAGRMPEAQRMAAVEAIAAKPRPAPAGQPQTPFQAPAPVQAPPAARPSLSWVWLAASAALVAAFAAVGVWRLTRPKPAPPPPPPEADEAKPPDPVRLAQQGRAELDDVLKAAKALDAAKGGNKLKGVQEAIGKLKAVQEKYKGTEAAEEAKKRLGPLQADAVFESALAYAREHPDDRAAIKDRLRELTKKFPDTDAAFRAGQELGKIEGGERDKAIAEFEAVQKRAGEAEAKERFGDALAQYDALLEKGVTEEVKQKALLEKVTIKSKAEKAFDTIDQQAQEKARGRYFDEAKALYGRVVANFGVPVYVARAQGRIAIIQPLLESASKRRLEAIDSAKYQFFLTRLDASRQRASAWDLDAAATEAEKLREDLKKEGIENYLDDYLADVGLLRSLKLRAIARLNNEADPVAVKQFSLGRMAGRIEPKEEPKADAKEEAKGETKAEARTDPAWMVQWREAKVVKADEKEVVFHYGEVDVHREWGQFPPDDLYRLGKLATDPKDPQSHALLGVHCFYSNLTSLAESEFNMAKAGGLDVATYVDRLKYLKGPTKAPVATTKQEEASNLLMSAKRYMAEREWDRALYRLALLKTRHAAKDYDVSANLDEINQLIAECKKNAERLDIEADLALGREVDLLARKPSEEWQQHFGKWGMDKGVLRGENTEDNDAEYLLSLRHAPSYELRATVRVVSGRGGILRLAGKTRPNGGFWIDTAKPDLVGLMFASATDDKAAERVPQRFPFDLGKDYEIRATVTPALIEVAIAGSPYLVRAPNKLPAAPGGVQTYGFIVDPKSVVEFKKLTVRVLREQ